MSSVTPHRVATQRVNSTAGLEHWLPVLRHYGQDGDYIERLPASLVVWGPDHEPAKRNPLKPDRYNAFLRLGGDTAAASCKNPFPAWSC